MFVLFYKCEVKKMTDVNNIISRLKMCVEKSGLSYVELEKRTGIAKSSIQRYVSGTTKKIPVDAIQSIAQAVGVSSKYILGWDSTQSPLSATTNDSPSFGSLTTHETAVITAYRNKPELQPAVDKLLDVPAEKQELKLVGRDGKIRKGKEAEDYLREANEQAAKITDKPEDFGI